MIISWKAIKLVDGKNEVVDKELLDVERVEVGKFGLHAFRDDFNFFIPFDDSVKSVRIK